MTTVTKKAQRTLIALAGGGALLGYLLASGAAAPLISDAVALVQGPAAEVTAASNDTTVNGDRIALNANTTYNNSQNAWMANDKRPEWSAQRMVPQGPTGASAAQKPAAPQAPAIQVPEDPKGRQFFTRGEPMRHYDLKPRGACPQSYGRGLYVQHFSAVPGKGSATVSWYDLGDPNAVEYQIDAVSVSDAGSVTTKKMAAPKACKEVSMTFTGLQSGTSYVFMLTATDVSPEQENRQYRVGRGQTPVIVVT